MIKLNEQIDVRAAMKAKMQEDIKQLKLKVTEKEVLLNRMFV